MKKSGKLLAWKFILLIQFVASCTLVVFAYKMDVLPVKTLTELIVVLVLALLGLGYVMNPKTFIKREQVPAKDGEAPQTRVKENPNGFIYNTIGKIVSLVVTIVLLIGTVYCTKTTKAVKKVAGNTTTVTTFNLYVMKNDNYSKLSDLKDQFIGFVPSVSTDAYTQASSKLNEALSYKTNNYKHTDDAADALYKSKVEAVFLSDAYGTVMKKRHPTFAKDTKVLWSVTITTSDKLAASDKDITKEPFVLYIAGVDSRHSITETSRADVNMLITVNPKTHQILLTSIPRDSFVPLANTNYQFKDKLTHACLFGTTNSVKTVNHLMNLNIDFYARVGFKMIINLVDAVGGVNIYSDKDFIPWTDHSVHVKKGWQKMNGKMALAFARERKSYNEGDRHRAANQQAVVKALIKKISASSTYLTHYNDIVNAIAGSFQTNITQAQLKALVKYQLDKSPKWKMMSTVLNGESEKVTGGYMMPNTALYYMILNQSSVDQNRQYIVDMLANKKIKIKKDQSLETEEDADSSTAKSSNATSTTSGTSTNSTTSPSGTTSTNGTTSHSTTAGSTSTTANNTTNSQTARSSANTTRNTGTVRSTTNSTSNTTRRTYNNRYSTSRYRGTTRSYTSRYRRTYR